MLDLLNAEETLLAKAMGWTLQHVYDHKLERWLVVVLPAVIGQGSLPTAEAAGAHVIGLARQGHALALKAIRLVMAGPVAQPKKGKKK